MDRFYRSVEASLLALGFALGLSAATLSSLPKPPLGMEVVEVTLPEISVGPDEPRRLP